MEFMNSVGSSSDVYRPSLFELIAQDRLNDLFRPALRYILTVYAQRYPRYLLKSLKYYDELYAVLMLIIENHYLYDWNASFSESFYGLRRMRKQRESSIISSDKEDIENMISSTQVNISNELDSSQVKKSLFFLVVAPYLKCKLDNLYDTLTGGEAARLLGDDFMEEEDEDEEDEEDEAIEHIITNKIPNFIKNKIDLKPMLRIGFGVKKIAKAGFIKCYPFAHLLYHIVPLTYYIAYLFERTDFHSPTNHWLGLFIKRMSEQDYRTRDQRKEQEKEVMIKKHFKMSKPKQMMHLAYIILKYGLNFLKVLLPISVFFLKFLEWWYSSSNYQKSTTTYLGPLPPPPKPIMPDNAGLPLPMDNNQCPICLKNRTNPAMLSTGYTFCYPCIFQYVQDHKHCPITLHQADLEDIRKLFSDEIMT